MKYISSIRNLKTVRLLALMISFAVPVYFANNLVSAVTYQTGVGVSFTFNPKLTLTLSSSNLVISNLAPGTSDNSNEIAITVSTNAAYGYNLSATVGNSTTYNNTDLTHTSGASSGKFTSIAFESNPANYISSISSNNTWGYSIDSGTKYNGLPLYSDTTNIATLKSTDTTPATGTDTINFLIGAKASTTQPTGDYKNVINFIAVTNPVPLTLEASYEAAGKVKYNGYYKLQDMNTTICDNADVLDEGSQMQAIDTRDGKLYWITKLQDNRCWMLDNLALDLTDVSVQANLTSATTNATDESLSYLKGTNSRNPSTDPNGKYATSGVIIETTHSYSVPQIITAYKDTTSSNDPLGEDANTWKYGIHYNYCAATAGSYCYGNGTSYNNNATFDATEDICPIGWRMPKNATGDSEYNALAVAMGINTYGGSSISPGDGTVSYRNALRLPLSGYIYDHNISNTEDRGFLWASTRANSTYTHYLRTDYNMVYVQKSNPTYYGYSVRCILK